MALAQRRDRSRQIGLVARAIRIRFPQRGVLTALEATDVYIDGGVCLAVLGRPCIGLVAEQRLKAVPEKAGGVATLALLRKPQSNCKCAISRIAVAPVHGVDVNIVASAIQLDAEGSIDESIAKQMRRATNLVVGQTGIVCGRPLLLQHFPSGARLHLCLPVSEQAVCLRFRNRATQDGQTRECALVTT